ncbi:hypothetical protein SAMN05421799_101272 [Alicyclobacillus vulcanalis]|uniref:Uncharacterized protein n=1 Tax=Alicyclobacillus vulcanalis TaxID=252246 RepID=A0A1N7K017_9BACL|nr:hypothetical protein SAMN05421799_101272 [Alicyclobacillus vulcanalis]
MHEGESTDESSALEVDDFSTSQVELDGDAYEAADMRANHGVLNVNTSLPVVRVQASGDTLGVGQGETIGLLQISPSVESFYLDNFGAIHFLVNSSPIPVSAQGTGAVSAAMGAVTTSP